MIEGRRGLGRGLAALLDESEGGPAPTESTTVGQSDVAIEDIHPNPAQPRQAFSKDELDALASSIRLRGVVQPILVRPIEGESYAYQIVAGERRWRAAQLAGLHRIPVFVRNLTDEAALEFALIENIQRSDLNPLEEARGYAELTRRFGRSQDDLAAAIGKSRSHVANTLRLLRLPSAVQEHLAAGRLTAGHARALLELAQPEAAAQRIIDQGMNVRQAEAMARQLRAGSAAGKSAARSRPRKDTDTRDLEANLTNVLGLAVEIRHSGGVGEIRLRYSNLEQLDELCRRLSRSG